MQMTLTITAESPSEMVTVLAALQGSGVGSAVELKAVQAAPAAPAPVEPVVEPRPASYPPGEVVVQTPRRGRPPRAGASVPTVPATVESALKEPSKLKVVPKDVPKVEEKKDITILDVRKALTEYLAANDENKAAALLAKHGKTDRLSKLDPEHFEAVYYAAVTPAVKDEFNDDIPDLGAAQ